RVRNARIPRRFRDARLVDFVGKQRRIAKWVREFADHAKTGTGLLIIGPRQVGKTFAACAALDHIVANEKDRRSGVYVTAGELAEMFMDTSRGGVLPDKWGNPHLLSYIHDTFDLVVIDDLGTESPSDYKTGRLFALLNERYNAMLPTIVTIRP